VPHFKYEDIKTVCTLFEKGDYFFTFDLKSAYHHIDIRPDCYKYLGFSWNEFVFSKICKCLVTWWRKLGFRTLMYLDDGTGCASSKAECSAVSTRVKQDVVAAGFLLSDKSHFEPMQRGEFLGYHIDLVSSELTVAAHRVTKLADLLGKVQDRRVTARTLARLAGSIISMGPAVGPVTRLRTRALYEMVHSVGHLDQVVRMSEECRAEVQFWSNCFNEFNGRPLRPLQPRSFVCSYSDASDSAWGGYTVMDGQEVVAHGRWPDEAAETSSTLRELKAARLVLDSLGERVRNACVIHRTDNQGAVSILRTGRDMYATRH